MSKRALTGWRAVLAYQDWALVPVFIICAIGVWIGDYGLAQTQRPVFNGKNGLPLDATISHQNHKDTIPYWVAIVVPAVVFILSMVIIELLLLNRRSASQVFTAMLLFFCSNTTSLVVTGCVTEILKTVNGRLRPDFLTRTPEQQEDGRKSFPSGHSSSSYAITWYSAFYIIWSLHWRYNQAWHRWKLETEGSSRTLTQVLKRVWTECLSAVLLLLAILQVAFAWGVGASRFRDNRHHVGDIVAGFLLALSFTPMFLGRAAGILEFNERMQAKLAADDEQEQQREMALQRVSVQEPAPVIVQPLGALAHTYSTDSNKVQGTSHGGAPTYLPNGRSF